jgi:hypothetical protein
MESVALTAPEQEPFGTSERTVDRGEPRSPIWYASQQWKHRVLSHPHHHVREQHRSKVPHDANEGGVRAKQQDDDHDASTTASSLTA